MPTRNKEHVRNGVIKANPDKMSRSSQRSFLSKCQIVWNHHTNLSINLVVKQDAFSNIFFSYLLRCSLVYYTQPPSGTVSTFIVYVSSYVHGKTVRMCRLV